MNLRPTRFGASTALVLFLFAGFAAGAHAAVPTLSKAFSPTSVLLNGSTTMSFGIGNPNATTITGVGFTDNLQPGLVVANPNGVSTDSCGTPTVTATPGSTGLSAVTMSGGSIAAHFICFVSVDVTGTWGGVRSNTVTVGSSAGSSSPSTATLTVAQPGVAPRIYWTNSTFQTVSFDNLDGTGGGDLPVGTATTGAGVSLDPAIGRAYWMHGGSPGGISYANLDGSGGGDVGVTGASTLNAADSALDPTTGRIYWVHNSAISFANLDGSSGADLNLSGATAPNGSGGQLTLDAAAGRIYWANPSANKISYANLNGSGGADLTITGVTPSGPGGLAVDSADGRIYWANAGNNTISYANLDGSNGHTLNITGATFSGAAGLAIDPVDGRLYWMNSSDKSISFASLSGGGVGGLNTVYEMSNALPALLRAPSAAGIPAITGGSTAGSVLSCSAGSWAPDDPGAHFYRAPQSYAYQWQLNGADIGGATSSSLTASSVGSYTCSVTASNFIGSAGPETSAPFSVQPAPAASSSVPTGQRAAALASCKKRAKKHHWPHKRLRKCKKKAKLLPV